MNGQRALQDWEEGDSFSASHLQEAIDMLRPLSTIMGGGITEVTQFPEGTAIYTPEPPPARRDFRVRVISAAPGAGKYYGEVIVTGTSTPVSMSTDLVAADLSSGAGEQVAIFNTYEKGTTGHWLTDPGSVPDRPIPAWWHDGGAMSDDDPPLRIACIADLGPSDDCIPTP